MARRPLILFEGFRCSVDIRCWVAAIVCITALSNPKIRRIRLSALPALEISSLNLFISAPGLFYIGPKYSLGRVPALFASGAIDLYN